MYYFLRTTKNEQEKEAIERNTVLKSSVNGPLGDTTMTRSLQARDGREQELQQANGARARR